MIYGFCPELNMPFVNKFNKNMVILGSNQKIFHESDDRTKKRKMFASPDSIKSCVFSKIRNKLHQFDPI